LVINTTAEAWSNEAAFSASFSASWRAEQDSRGNTVDPCNSRFDVPNVILGVEVIAGDCTNTAKDNSHMQQITMVVQSLLASALLSLCVLGHGRKALATVHC
jgi:hypothetical protein